MSTELDKQARALFSELFFAKTQAAKEKLILEAFSQVREQSIAECAKVLCEICATGKSYHRFMEAVPHLDDTGEWRHEPKKLGGSCLCDAAEIRAIAAPPQTTEQERG